jgi:hypothetical protein
VVAYELLGVGVAASRWLFPTSGQQPADESLPQVEAEADYAERETELLAA